MGKAEEDLSLSTLQASSEISEGNACGRCPHCRSIGRIVQLRCIAALVLGVAVLLSAVFWLPPFLKYGADRGNRDPDSNFGADITVSFKLQKPVSLLNANILKLQYDIFEEIGVPNSTVVVMSLDPLAGPNWTSVVFGIWPNPKNSNITSTGLSILRASLVSLVIQQSSLHLTPSLFGNSSFFQVLKFPGGITIIPPQSAFLLQKVQSLFNFTLNSPIYQVLEKIGELKDQMKSGLVLSSYENLYVSLTNLVGSTMDPPTTVQTSILLAVGNLPPSLPRLKQLAQTITGPSAGNLGLNHTVFGRVKEIRLSSFLQHSLNSGGSSGTSRIPSPAPQPYPNHHHHQHHYHHNWRHHPDMNLAPAPAPQYSYQASPPSGCRFGYSGKPKSKAHLAPANSPVPSSHHASALHLHGDPPAPASDMLPTSPLPAVFNAPPVQPPSESVRKKKPPDGMPSISPSPSSTSVADHQPSVYWVLASFLFLLIRL